MGKSRLRASIFKNFSFLSLFRFTLYKHWMWQTVCRVNFLTYPNCAYRQPTGRPHIPIDGSTYRADLGISRIVLGMAATVTGEQVRDNAVRILCGRRECRERGRYGRIRGAVLVVLAMNRRTWQSLWGGCLRLHRSWSYSGSSRSSRRGRVKCWNGERM